MAVNTWNWLEMAAIGNRLCRFCPLVLNMTRFDDDHDYSIGMAYINHCFSSRSLALIALPLLFFFKFSSLDNSIGLCYFYLTALCLPDCFLTAHCLSDCSWLISVSLTALCPSDCSLTAPWLQSFFLTAPWLHCASLTAPWLQSVFLTAPWLPSVFLTAPWLPSVFWLHLHSVSLTAADCRGEAELWPIVVWSGDTCVSSMHSRKCVTLLKLRTE